MVSFEILEISNIDDFDDEKVIHVELEMKDDERVQFGINNDGEDYSSKCWLVMATINNDFAKFLGFELYYVSNNGLIVAEKQLSSDEKELIKQYIVEHKNNI